MIQAPDSFLYIIVLSSGLIFAIIYYLVSKRGPSLTSVFTVITAVAAIYMGGELVFNVIFNDALILGQLKESKLIIILGGVAVTWVGGNSLIDTCQKIKNND